MYLTIRQIHIYQISIYFNALSASFRALLHRRRKVTIHRHKVLCWSESLTHSAALLVVIWFLFKVYRCVPLPRILEPCHIHVTCNKIITTSLSLSHSGVCQKKNCRQFIIGLREVTEQRIIVIVIVIVYELKWMSILMFTTYLYKFLWLSCPWQL